MIRVELSPWAVQDLEEVINKASGILTKEVVKIVLSVSKVAPMAHLVAMVKLQAPGLSKVALEINLKSTMITRPGTRRRRKSKVNGKIPITKTLAIIKSTGSNSNIRSLLTSGKTRIRLTEILTTISKRKERRINSKPLNLEDPRVQVSSRGLSVQLEVPT
jgi:hypothetical protein